MKQIECMHFIEIVNYETKSLSVIEKEFFEELKKHEEISAKTFTITHTTKFKSNKHLDFLLSAFDRHVRYSLLARSQFQPYRIHHILHNINASMLILKPKNCRSIVTCHDLHSGIPLQQMEYKLHKGGVLRYFFKNFSNQAFKRADIIIAVSKNTKEDLIKYLKIPEGKILVIYNGVNHEVFKPRDKSKARAELQLPEDKSLVLNVASDEPRKNIETLIKAIFDVSKSISDLQFLHVGTLSDKSTKLISEFKLEKIVKNYKEVSEQELTYLYNAADVFVFPSFYEGFGLPPLEAMASGCPSIVSDRSSLPEVVGNGGIMIDPNDSEALAQRIKEVLANQNLQAQMIQKGQEQAKKFSWAKCVEETVAVYHTLMQ